MSGDYTGYRTHSAALYRAQPEYTKASRGNLIMTILKTRKKERLLLLLLAVFAIMFIPPADQTEEPQNQDCKT